MRISDWSSDVCSSDLEYHRQCAVCNSLASTQEESDAGFAALSAAIGRIEAATPRTPAGHCAWLRAMFDSYEGSIIEDHAQRRMLAVAYSVHGITPPAA